LRIFSEFFAFKKFKISIFFYYYYLKKYFFILFFFRFTFALLEDTNWFKVPSDLTADPLIWGRNRGCDFFSGAC
jgi:hypothetical protein